MNVVVIVQCQADLPDVILAGNPSVGLASRLDGG
jgi:hypothetical protein